MEALKIVVLMGLMFTAFGPSYSYSFVRIIHGKEWSDGEASTALSYYCIYIITLAINGTSEAFLHAVATKDQLYSSNIFMIICSVSYIVLNIILLRLAGIVGLIAANSINMSLRIIYSAVFIRQYFQNSSTFEFRGCLPSGWLMLLFSAGITLLSERLFLDKDNFWPTFFLHFLVGLACICLSSFVIYRHEKDFIKKILNLRKHVD